MGQRWLDSGGGRGTVRMGRSVVLDIGGECATVAFAAASVSCVRGSIIGPPAWGFFSFKSAGVGAPPFVDVSNVTPDFSLPGRGAVDSGGDGPDITGGGNSRPSEALRVSWRAKSLACHHSRNLRAKIEVGRRIFRLERSVGYTLCDRVRGLNILAGAGGAPGRVGGGGGGLDARSMALWSAALSLRMRVPTRQRKGEEKLVLSKR